MLLKVFVVGRSKSIEDMFYDRGWDIAANLRTPVSLICFTGGGDLSPIFYGEEEVDCRGSDFSRDYEEFEIFNKNLEIPKVGICRGAQVLNVFSGGKLWQDVDNHHGEHEAIDLLTNQPVMVSSTHHQMMRPARDAEVICVTNRSTRYLHDGDDPPPEFDPEVLWYYGTRSLCFQPHPEYGGKKNHCREYFFDLLEYFYGYA